MPHPNFLAAAWFALLHSLFFSPSPQYVTAGFTASSGASYTGPGDIITSNVFGWWGLRCYDNAYSGNVADIWDGATGNTTETLLTCSSGGTINQTVNSLATTCAVSCKVKTLYDQSGAGKCSGACNMSEATNSQRPALTLNCLNSTLPCMTYCSTCQLYSNVIGSTTSQPYSMSSVYKSSSGSGSTILQAGYAAEATDGNTGAQLYAGISVNVTVTGSVYHAFQALFNGASSSAYVDGSSTTGLNAGTNSLGYSAPIGTGQFSNSITGTFAEYGIWSVDESANFAALNTNQHSYWGF
jgi:hypothetical protein